MSVILSLSRAYQLLVDIPKQDLAKCTHELIFYFL
jgi:hypothetical protein